MKRLWRQTHVADQLVHPSTQQHPLVEAGGTYSDGGGILANDFEEQGKDKQPEGSLTRTRKFILEDKMTRLTQIPTWEVTF